MKYLTRTIWMLSLISLFTDMASEMLYPIMPLYLQQIGFSIAGIGLLEGVAEAVAGLSKGYFGKWSDSKARRSPFIQFGYGLSALSKPLMAIFIQPVWIFFARSIDRLGKGIRTGARDALLSAASSPATKARVFGFHRSMDTLGAVIGPLLALLFLFFYPGQYRTLFLCAFIPGIAAVTCSMFIREKPTTEKPFAKKALLGFLSYWKESPADFRRLVRGLLMFAVLNSSDVFLLLAAKSAGCDDGQVILLYVFYNVVYALAAFPAGMAADRWGVRRMFLTGLLFFAMAYGGFAFAHSLPVMATLFFIYGLYAAATEGVAKAWMALIIRPSEMGTAVGTYTSLQSIASLLASALAGWIWVSKGKQLLFLLAAIGTLGLIFYFLLLTRKIRVNAGNA